MDPIPLRTLTLLLSYERTTSDSRFEGWKLVDSSFAAGSSAITDFRRRQGTFSHALLNNSPQSVTGINYHHFEKTPAPLSISPTVEISPNAVPGVRDLTRKKLDLIYHELHNHNACLDSTKLFECFFQICLLGQIISVQLENETPVLINPEHRLRVRYTVNGPKQLTICVCEEKIGTQDISDCLITGELEAAGHAVILFDSKDSSKRVYAVDMSRLQYGKAGQGKFGENYFLSTIDTFEAARFDICDRMIMVDLEHNILVDDQKDQWLKECAKRVLGRWERRDKEGWCEHCGIGGTGLLLCTGCVEKIIRYCCKDHQRLGWKLHQHTCERRKNRPEGE